MHQYWWQRVVERRANSTDQGGFADRELAIMRDRSTNCAQQGLLALVIQPQQHVETTVKDGDSVAVIGLIVIRFCPGRQRRTARLVRGFTFYVGVMSVAREHA